MNRETMSIEELEKLEQEYEIELLRLAKIAAEHEGVVPFARLVEQYEALHGESLKLPAEK